MKIAVIGLGDIAQKAYLPVITQKTDIELVLCSRSKPVLSGMADKYRIKEFNNDYKSLLGSNIDGVMIHAATAVHTEVASFFLQHGIATFVDKPLANSAADCELLYEYAEKHKTPLYVGFNRRHLPLQAKFLSGVQQGLRPDLFSLRWEKHRHNQPGKVRDFIFDDFIHPLDSVNIFAKSTLDDMDVIYHQQNGLLGRIDVHWQQKQTLLHASMDRLHGVTRERISADFASESYEFNSFDNGTLWKDNQQSSIGLKDWTPMLTSKGFDCMIDDWFRVVNKGRLESEVINRNIATHQLAEQLCNKIGKL
ncbi:Gfo/Idh/MocA family protein [Vibrio sp. SCSIO 43137]|uniref:Gfo/Idh/MocA family protein n=1 Tax=Vibrio sp. SCSIO 43137 TaxID=3021011 RepID=UPI002307EAD9|nr:Gfo/Idh/MocA family oxidoreductase [Vibrio sp. SCSIO 43137]WCE29013.1 Gfo/Idh/MocA family oxidoreductase [Vibrio sp. SCSIO 43137]